MRAWRQVQMPRKPVPLSSAKNEDKISVTADETRHSKMLIDAIVVHEFKSSACCRICDTNSMVEVAVRKANWKDIPDERERSVTPWELRACCEDECPEYQRLVNRNFNACINMRRLYWHTLVHGVRSRPAGLSRTPQA